MISDLEAEILFIFFSGQEVGIEFPNPEYKIKCIFICSLYYISFFVIVSKSNSQKRFCLASYAGEDIFNSLSNNARHPVHCSNFRRNMAVERQ